MKAIVCTQYGSPDVMQLQEVSKPVPKDNEVLIKIHAATVTAGDCEIRRFDIPVLFWLPLRLYLGITKPKNGIFGQELAGEVETAGGKVTRFKKGDHIFAYTTMRLGAYAQFICLPESNLTSFNPSKMSYAEAATIPTGGVNALHFTRKANIQTGESVLISGAGGSIGTYALQFALSAGALVTCVDSKIKLPMLRALGAAHVIDFKQEDFTGNGKTYDVIIDVAGKTPYSRSVRSLTQQGRYVLGNPEVSGMLRGLWTSMTSKKKAIFEFAAYKSADLVFIKEMIESRKVKPVIDKRYSLQQLPEAHRYVEEGFKAGNVVIEIE
ncbi:MAG: NAD(P)-dependent alcohol dehydrogenase [Cyclobacteriaceae bacterium]